MVAEACSYHNKELKGKMRATVWGVTHSRGGGFLFLDALDTKSRCPVLEVLVGKHLELKVPDLTNPECSSFAPYLEVLEAIPLDFTGDDLALTALQLTRASRAGGGDTIEMQNWLV